MNVPAGNTQSGLKRTLILNFSSSLNKTKIEAEKFEQNLYFDAHHEIIFIFIDDGRIY